LGERDQVGAQAGVAALHAGLAEVAVIEHDQGQVGGLFGADCRQAANAHQVFAVAGDDHYRLLGLRQRQSQRHRRGTAHRAP